MGSFSIFHWLMLVLFLLPFAAWIAIARHYKKQDMGFFKRHLRGLGGFFVGYLALLIFDITYGEKPSARAVQTVKPVVSTPPVVEKEKPFAIHAGKLADAYETNEVAADQQFKGRPLAITGTVQSVDKDVFDSIVIELVSTNPFMPIHAYPDGGYENHIAGLRKGQRISLICTGGGKIMGSPVLRDCRPVGTT